jgi:hypothetical protein
MIEAFCLADEELWLQAAQKDSETRHAKFDELKAYASVR